MSVDFKLVDMSCWLTNYKNMGLMLTASSSSTVEHRNLCSILFFN